MGFFEAMFLPKTWSDLQSPLIDSVSLILVFRNAFTPLTIEHILSLFDNFLLSCEKFAILIIEVPGYLKAVTYLQSIGWPGNSSHCEMNSISAI
jgi:hypothetical protein